MDKEKEEERRKQNRREMRERSKQRERERERERERNGREKKKKRFSRYSDDRSSTVREEKLIHASRPMRGYQNLGVSSNSTR